VALISQDELGGYVAGAPEYLAPAAEATQASTINTETIYADDQPYEIFTAKGETNITLTVTNVPLELLAELTGQYYDAASGLFYEYGGVAPYYALMFRSKKSNGSYRYYTFYKVRFDLPDEEATTLGETPEPKMMEINVHAIKTTCKFDIKGDGTIIDGLMRLIGDEDITLFDGSDWFDAVAVPTVYSPSS
jgi:phi13 family phage major tail protein